MNFSLLTLPTLLLKRFLCQSNLPSSSTVRSTTSAAFCLRGWMTVEILLRDRASGARAAWEPELWPQCDLECPSAERDLSKGNTSATGLHFASINFFSSCLRSYMEFFIIRKAFCYTEIPWESLSPNTQTLLQPLPENITANAQHGGL